MASDIEKIMSFLIKEKYAVQIKGTGTWSGIRLYTDGDESVYELPDNYIFSSAMIHSVAITHNRRAVIDLVH